VTRLRVDQADITTLAIDAIVNADNEALLPGGGVDGAIHDAAGPELLRACLQIAELRPGVRCPAGQARITPGFGLPVRFVIHTVAPVWRGGKHGEADVLASCYRSAFALAGQHGVRTLAFPALGCGAFGYPLRSAARIAVHEARTALATLPHLEAVRLVAIESDVEDELRRALQADAG